MAGPKKPESKKAVVGYGLIGDIFEAGFIGGLLGQAIPIAIREAVRGYVAGKNPTDGIDWTGFAALRKTVAGLVKKETGDSKLAELYDEYVAKRISIAASSKSDSDKEHDLQQALKDYKAAVNERRLALKEQGFQGMLASLTADERFVFTQWLEGYTLTQEMRDKLLARKSAIKSASTIRETIDIGLKLMQAETIPDLYLRWTWVATDAGWRAAWERASKAMYDYLVHTALPEPSVTEQLGGIVSAALQGTIDEHPVVQKLAGRSADSVAQRDDAAAMTDRCFRNRRSI